MAEQQAEPHEAVTEKKRPAAWLTVLIGFLVLALGLFLGGIATYFFAKSPFSVTTEQRNQAVVKAITREEQVVLMALGIQGISEKSANSKFFGLDIPGTDRASFLMYEFDAKLGLDGESVQIRPGDADEIVVSLPRFIFIGYDNYKFRLVAENNGALSWVTPENDPVEMINSVLTDETKAQYIEANREQLDEQARAFYTGIISSVDPELTVRYEYLI